MHRGSIVIVERCVHRDGWRQVKLCSGMTHHGRHSMQQAGQRRQVGSRGGPAAAGPMQAIAVRRRPCLRGPRVRNPPCLPRGPWSTSHQHGPMGTWRVLLNRYICGETITRQAATLHGALSAHPPLAACSPAACRGHPRVCHRHTHTKEHWYPLAAPLHASSTFTLACTPSSLPCGPRPWSGRALRCTRRFTVC